MIISDEIKKALGDPLRARIIMARRAAEHFGVDLDAIAADGMRVGDSPAEIVKLVARGEGYFGPCDIRSFGRHITKEPSIVNPQKTEAPK